MRIHDIVVYRGQEYFLRGLEPMSVLDRRAQLEDPRTGEHILVPLSEVEEAPPKGP